MKSALLRILRSPILHFVLAGALLFGIAFRFDRGSSGGSGGAGGGASDAATIRVERDDLIAYIQSRTRMARPEEAQAAFDSGTPAVRQDWIDRFVREEALVREARTLGLERDDELIRRRLVQQVEFLVEGVGEEAISVSEAEVRAAHAARASTYRHPATFRFAHVFIREFEGHEGKAADRAKGIRDEMNRKQVRFDEGYPYGDRFLYDRTYVDRTLDEVRSHFGDEFVKAIERLDPDPGRWTGPYRSEHGFHLVLLTEKQPERASSFEDVAGELREELLREKREKVLEQGVSAIVAKFEVELGDGLAAAPAVREPR